MKYLQLILCVIICSANLSRVSSILVPSTPTEVYERSSPPAPVELLPSNAGQDIAPTQSAGERKTWSSSYRAVLFVFPGPS